MLQKPKCGWSAITIGEWHDRCSYLVDVPIDLLKAVSGVIALNTPQAVEIDAEGYNYVIVFNAFETHIITETDDGYTLTTIDIGIRHIAKELVSDIEADLDSWVEWPPHKQSAKDKLVHTNVIKEFCQLIGD